MTRNRKQFALYSIVLAASLGGVQAEAGEIVARAAYRPSELTSAQGTDAVVQRLQRAARRACRADSPFKQDECRKDLAGQMAAKIGDPAVLARINGTSVQFAERAK